MKPRLISTSVKHYVTNNKCYMTEGYKFINMIFLRTFPSRCIDNSTRVDHLLQTLTLTAWADKIARDYMLVYIGHGSDFAESVWVKREDTMLIRQDTNFSIPIFSYE